MAGPLSDHRDWDNHDSPQVPARQPTTSSSFCFRDSVELRGLEHPASRGCVSSLFSTGSAPYLITVPSLQPPTCGFMMHFRVVISWRQAPPSPGDAGTTDLLVCHLRPCCTDGARPALPCVFRSRRHGRWDVGGPSSATAGSEAGGETHGKAGQSGAWFSSGRWKGFGCMSTCTWAQTLLASEMGGLSISDQPLHSPPWHVQCVPFGFHLYTSPPPVLSTPEQ